MAKEPFHDSKPEGERGVFSSKFGPMRPVTLERVKAMLDAEIERRKREADRADRAEALIREIATEGSRNNLRPRAACEDYLAESRATPSSSIPQPLQEVREDE